MNCKVIDIQFGKYDCNTIFIQVDKDIVQIPINKKVEIPKDLIEKSIIIDDLYNVPLNKIVLANIK